MRWALPVLFLGGPAAATHCGSACVCTGPGGASVAQLAVAAVRPVCVWTLAVLCAVCCVL